MALKELVVERPEYAVPDLAVQKYPFAKNEMSALISEKLSAYSFARSVATMLSNEQCLVYSVNVVDPPNISRFVDEASLPSGLHSDAKRQFMTGYFYNEEILKCSVSDVQKSLFAILKFAKKVEIAARPDETRPMIRNRLEIVEI